MHVHGRLVLLLVLHAACAGLLCGFCKATGGKYPGIDLVYLPLVVLLALTLAQACLAGFWAAFSGASPRARLLGLVGGALGLEFMVAAGSDDDDFRFMASIAAAVIAVVLLAARRGRADLRRVSTAVAERAGEGFRWSIRGLMLFTLAVGLLVGGARGARESLGNAAPSLLLCGAWSLCLVVQALAAAWAALGLARPWLRATTVMLCAAATGALFAHGIGEDNDWKSLTYFVTVNAGQSAIVLGSLLVVRSAGYRLVGRARPGEVPKVLAGSVEQPGERLAPEPARTESRSA